MVCCCSAPYYNPNACKSCNNYTDFKANFPFDNRFIVIKTKKVTERFDKNGNLIEKIVESNE